jgi:hypothetical protein
VSISCGVGHAEAVAVHKVFDESIPADEGVVSARRRGGNQVDVGVAARGVVAFLLYPLVSGTPMVIHTVYFEALAN